ncbi:MAG: hypothetical protein ACK5RT_12990 [Dolichospermum sp.]|jgi:hypothetical protein
MRSNELKTFQDKISELNRHYSHFLFISEQFVIDNQLLVSSTPDSYTCEIFTNNKFADQFNSKLKTLIGETEQTTSFILRSLFLLSYFQFEIYLRDIYNFTRVYITELPELTRKSLLDQVEVNLQLKKLNGLSLLEFDTIDYIRLRRNAFVHRDEEKAFQGTIADFIKENGKKINKYWESSDLKIQSLDFTKKDIESIESLEVIDILNIIRRLSEKIDKFVIAKVGLDNLNQYLIEKFENEYQPVESWEDKQKLIRKFKHFARVIFGATMTDEEVIALLEK